MAFGAVRWIDWTLITLILSVGYVLHSFFPHHEWFARSGAICILGAAIIAAMSSREIQLNANDSLDISALPHIDATEDEMVPYWEAESDRLKEATNIRDSRFVRVPLWAAIGTLTTTFGDFL